MIADACGCTSAVDGPVVPYIPPDYSDRANGHYNRKTGHRDVRVWSWFAGYNIMEETLPVQDRKGSSV